jgi:hypothetical protein
VTACFGAKGDGANNDTAAIRYGVVYAATHNLPLLIPSRTYEITPADNWTTNEAAITILGAFPLLSNLDIEAEPGARFLVSSGVSTDTSPTSMAIFYTSDVVSNITIKNLTIDMNGQNNPISPNRASLVYNRFPQAQIYISGSVNGAGHLPAASASNVILVNDSFVNNAGGSNIVMAQSNVSSAVLGSDWTINNCLFENDGLDNDDASSIFGWANNVIAQGNTFTTDYVFGTQMPYSGAPVAGLAGPQVAYEVHGSNTRFVNNTVYGYNQGLWLATNITNSVTRTLVVGNTFRTLFFGAATYYESAAEQGISDILFTGNNCYFDDTSVAAVPALNLKQCITVVSQFPINDLTATANHMYKEGTTVASTFGVIGGSNTPGRVSSGIYVTGNTGYNLSGGTNISANAGGLGTIIATGNSWIGLTPAGSAYAIGDNITTGATGTIGSLTLGGGSTLNLVPQANAFGMYLDPIIGTLTITNLAVLPHSFLGMGAGNYAEAGAITVTNRIAVQASGLIATSLDGATIGANTPAPVNGTTAKFTGNVGGGLQSGQSPNAGGDFRSNGGLPATSGSTNNSALRVGFTDGTWSGGAFDCGISTVFPYASWCQSRNPNDFSVSRPHFLNPGRGDVIIGSQSDCGSLLCVGNSQVPVSTSTQTAGQLVCIKTAPIGDSPAVYGTCTAVSGASCTNCN